MKLFSKKKNRSNQPHRSDQIGAHPERDWFVILIVFICLNVATIGFHAFLFYQISRGSFFTVPESAPTVSDSIDRERLIETLEVFNKKEQKLVESVTTEMVVPAVK